MDKKILQCKVYYKKVGKALKRPKLVLIVLLYKIAPLFPDELYLRLLFYLKMGKFLNLKNPQTFNEKLQWLKLYNRKPEYTKMVDKYAVKDYVASIIGEEYIIPTLGVYNNVDEIDFDKLPNQFVLKCTHDSGGIVICRDKAALDINAAKEKLRRGLMRNYYYQNREWPYKNVPRRIIAEKYMVDESGCELKDYKFFCFDGEPKVMLLVSGRNAESKYDFMDMSFCQLPFERGHVRTQDTNMLVKPKGFEKMKKLAAILSKNLPHIRVDFYDIKGKIYFGELTFYPASGFASFTPIEWDYTFGSWLKLPL